MHRFLTIQEHNAERAGLHWDLRISYKDGPSEQKSWVIPKARLPENEKLLAIEVEDHPWGYRNFSGVISKGYGKGTVKLVHASNTEVNEFSDKKVKFLYNGKKYSLIKMSNKKWLITESKR